MVAPTRRWSWSASKFLATLHPSAILRADNQQIAYERFRADLGVVAEALARK